MKGCFEDMKCEYNKLFTNNFNQDKDNISFNQINKIESNNKPNNDIYLFYKNKFSIEKIKKLFQEIGIPANIIELIKKEYLTKIDLDNVNLFCMKKKRKKRDKNINEENSNVIQGRKRKDDHKKGKHNKHSYDNIAKKIKVILFTYLIEYTNIFLEQNKISFKGTITFYKLNYKKYINQSNKKTDTEMLDTKIMDLLKKSINGHKSKTIGEDYNEILLDKLLKEENDNEIIIDYLHMKFREWINIFTLKSDKYQNDDFKYDLLKSVIIKQVNNLEEIENNEEKEMYFTRLIFYLFNYQNFLFVKKGRKSKNNKNDKSEENKENKNQQNKNEEKNHLLPLLLKKKFNTNNY